MKWFRIGILSLFFGLCILGNKIHIQADEGEEVAFILETQEVEGEKHFDMNPEDEIYAVQGVSTYYSQEKGWTFNDIVYVDACPKYDSSYGGTSIGTLEAGYYRFVKSNRSYVALCEVNLVADTLARMAYQKMWKDNGGMWSWNQALYNQLDGTPERGNISGLKTVTLDGRDICDEAQNFRFIKCWIEVEDFAENPDYKEEQENEDQVYYLTIKFHPNGGAGEMYSETIPYGERRILEKCPFRNEKAVFMGWADMPGVKKVAYAIGAEIENTTNTQNVELNLYAVWDYEPEIELCELYFLKSDLMRQEDVGAFVLSYGTYFDREDGQIPWDHPWKVEMLTDLRPLLEESGRNRITYKVQLTDSIGNVCTQEGSIRLLGGKAIEIGNKDARVRFVSLAYLETLEDDSVWVKNTTYRRLLMEILRTVEKITWKKTEFGWQRVK